MEVYIKKKKKKNNGFTIDDNNCGGSGKKRRLSIAERRKLLDKEAKLVTIDCPHIKKNGDFNTRWVNKDKGIVECKECGTVFRLKPETDEDIAAAVKVLHNVLNQCKAFSPKPKSEKEMEYIKKYGKLDYSLSELLSVYNQIKKSYMDGDNEKKHKKHKKYNDSYGYGSMGAESLIKFGDDHKKKKKKKKDCFDF